MGGQRVLGRDLVILQPMHVEISRNGQDYNCHKKNPLIKKLKYGKVPHSTCSASTADEMEFNLDFGFLEYMSPLMLFTCLLSAPTECP
jgi:hypothetical protein